MDVQKLIDRIVSSERMQASAHFSDQVFRDEPILKTGRQMANYLPDEYRAMRAISRWQEGAHGAPGRWLSEAELFYRQAQALADVTDDCPYQGTFKSYYPTYNAMSDRQLRGYITWRTAVRSGDVQEASPAFAYVYLYELLCGVGVHGAENGFGTIKAFWQAYRALDATVDRYAEVWLHDYVIYHGLSPALLNDSPALQHDRALATLITASDRLHEAAQAQDRARRGRRRASDALGPLGDELERDVAHAIDALSTYRITQGRFYREHPQDTCHVLAAVWVRLMDYYRKHRANGLIESLFGSRIALSYTMFASAVFFDPVPHPDAVYQLDELSRYRCSNGMWTCERVQPGAFRKTELGAIVHAVDWLLRAGFGFDHPLQETRTKAIPKYLATIIDREVAGRVSWSATHAPRVIDIDLNRLSGIRAAAALTREALLVDEERDGAGELVDAAAVGAARRDGTADEADAVATGASLETVGAESVPVAAGDEHPAASVPVRAPLEREKPRQGTANALASAGPGPAEPEPASAADPDTALDPSGPLTGVQRAYLSALLANDAAARDDAVHASGQSEDLLVDELNGALFDEIGDTVVEWGAEGPALIEDYIDDVKEILAHG